MTAMETLTWIMRNWELPLSILGGILALWKLKQLEVRSKTSLENNLNKEYRSIIRQMPVEALVNEKVEDWKKNEGNSDRIDAIYPYIDLSNQQVFLRKRGRITSDRWEDWQEGIRIHLSQHDEFERAWDEIQTKTDIKCGKSFEELRRLDNEYDFDTDPYYWNSGPVKKLYRDILAWVPKL